jgi:hypothetical protein
MNTPPSSQPPLWFARVHYYVVEILLIALSVHAAWTVIKVIWAS